MRRLAEITHDHRLEHSEFVRHIAIENIHRDRFIKQIDALHKLSKPALGILDDILIRGNAIGVFRANRVAIAVRSIR